MTFKDFGFKVGKLDSAWKKLTHDDVAITREENGTFFTSAKNKSMASTLYFKITQSGELIDVSIKPF